MTMHPLVHRKGGAWSIANVLIDGPSQLRQLASPRTGPIMKGTWQQKWGKWEEATASHPLEQPPPHADYTLRCVHMRAARCVAGDRCR